MLLLRVSRLSLEVSETLLLFLKTQADTRASLEVSGRWVIETERQ